MRTILVIDDERSMREFLSIMLEREGYSVVTKDNGNDALEFISKNKYDLIITDIKMPKMSGIDILRESMALHPNTPVIMITAFASTEVAVEAMKLGAYDYITKPFNVDEIKIIIKNAIEKKSLFDENISLKEELKGRYQFSNIVGKSDKIHKVFDLIMKVANSKSTVLITGESGTGKELVARAIHHKSDRKDKPFVSISCGAIPETLLESELFGHQKGAFTGADSDKKGLFEEAHGGTLFLDEVADLDPSLQVKLLRVLQEGEVQRIGDTKTIKVDVRIISASHKPLDELTKKGGFREDLYYRLCQIRVTIPPLDERKEDIALLAENFIVKYCEENKITEKLKLAPELMRLLHDYNWPGNVRELENIINVACALRSNTVLDINSIPQHSGLLQNMQTTMKNFSSDGNQKKIPLDNQNIFDPSKTWEIYETIIIAKCFKLNGFKKRNTAAMLDISPSTLYKKLKDFSLEDHQSPYYSDPFVYTSGKTLREYIPTVFQAALVHADNHPYAAIRQLDISQGFFYKVIKPLRQETSLSTLGPG